MRDGDVRKLFWVWMRDVFQLCIFPLKNVKIFVVFRAFRCKFLQ